MQDSEKQFCPVCGVEIPFWERYPRAVCSPCSSEATDFSGRKVGFLNEELSGGIQGRYQDTHEAYPGFDCWIKDFECLAEEHRFAGVVIQVLETF